MLGATDCVHRDAVAQRYFDDISSYLSVYFTTIGLVARRRPLEYGLRDLFGNVMTSVPRHGQHPIKDLAGYCLRLILSNKNTQVVCVPTNA